MKVGSVTAGAAINSQAEWFDADLAPPANRDGKFQIHVSITTSVALAYTLDSGTTWVDMNNGAALTANIGYVLTLPVDDAVAFNIRKSTSGNVTPNFCEVHLF